MEQIGSNDFNASGRAPKPAIQMPLYLQLGYVYVDKTGPVSNITMVIQKALDYTGPQNASVHEYTSYPTDISQYHPNPVSGVSQSSVFDVLIK